MMLVLWNAFLVAALIIGLYAGSVLMMRLLRTVATFIEDTIEVAAAVFFFVLIVPPVWLWEKCRRRMFRTLSPQQSQELRAWLKSQ